MTDHDCSDSDDPCLDGTLRLPPGDRSLAGTMQEGRDLMFAELAGVDMRDADFYWAMFNEAMLEDAMMAGCDLRGAVLNKANLRGADLRRANCALDNLGGSTDFIETDLSGADLRDVRPGRHPDGGRGDPQRRAGLHREALPW